jgi:hypothetical protein
MGGVRFLWLGSRVPQALFEAACQMPALEGLHIKWSGIGDLSAITHCTTLRYFHLGQSSQVRSIAPLGHLRLRWLGLELLSKVKDLSPLENSIQLEGLTLEGSMSTPWSVRTLEPLSRLGNLRYLSIAGLKAEDRSLTPLLSIARLETFHHATWWPEEQLSEIHKRIETLKRQSHARSE